LILNGNILLPYRQKQFENFVNVFNQKIQKKNNNKKVKVHNLQKMNLLTASFYPTEKD